MKVAGVIEDAKRYVVGYYEDEDEQYVHWLDEDWLSYVRLAVGILAMADAEAFTKVIDIDLVAGSVQELPDTCENLKSVRGMRDDDGVISSLIRKRSSATLKLPTLSRPSCRATTKGSSEYVVKSYTIDESDPRAIYVDPPVPKGFSGTMVLTCYSPPKVVDEDSELDLNSTQMTVLFELLLYYAWGVDIEDQANRERSDTHWKNAMTLLDIQDKTKQRFLKNQARLARENG